MKAEGSWPARWINVEQQGEGMLLAWPQQCAERRMGMLPGVVRTRFPAAPHMHAVSHGQTCPEGRSRSTDIRRLFAQLVAVGSWYELHDVRNDRTSGVADQPLGCIRQWMRRCHCGTVVIDTHVVEVPGDAEG